MILPKNDSARQRSVAPFRAFWRIASKMTGKLSNADVSRLLQDPSPEARADAAAKIATHYQAAAEFGEHEKKLAEEIFSLMCRDAEQRVREALSNNLKDCPFLPRETAVTLANDVEAVSVPMLQFSSVLTDEDLIAIIHSQSEEKQKAIASRSSVSAGVSDALIDTHNETIIGTLVANDGADLSAPSMHRVLDEFSDSEIVKQSMAGRSSLPVEVTERLVAVVSAQLQQELMLRKELSSEQVADLIVQSREKATLGLLGGSRDARRLIVHLYQNERLTPTIVLRALCMGDMEFFEGSIAVLSRIPLSTAREIIHSGDTAACHNLFRKAGLPRPLHPAFSAAIEVTQETDYDGGENDRERFRRRLIERIITHFEDPDDVFGGDNVEYLMARLSQIDYGFALRH